MIFTLSYNVSNHAKDRTVLPRFKSPENKWFTINYNIASQVLKDVHKNYTKYLVKSKQLQVLTSQKFNLNKMRELLVREVDEVLKDVPQEVKLKLPKLKKV